MQFDRLTRSTRGPRFFIWQWPSMPTKREKTSSSSWPEDLQNRNLRKLSSFLRIMNVKRMRSFINKSVLDNILLFMLKT